MKNDIKVLAFLDVFIRTITVREANNGQIGLKQKSVNNYLVFKKMWVLFEAYELKSYRFRDLDKTVVEDFKFWLLEEKNFSPNTAGRHFGTLKTLCSEAKKSDYKVHKYCKYIKGFSRPKDQESINTLSLEEIRKISELQLDSERLDNARRWIILGVWLGQRVSDLLNITQANIRKSNIVGYYVDLTQQKTGHKITIGVANKNAIQIIEEGLPRKINSKLFNELLKEVLALAGVTQKVKGYKFNKKTKRKEFGEYKKCEIMASHDLRRTFATNFYGKIETPIIMRMTGHSREHNFLRYIGKNEDLDYVADTFISKVNALEMHTAS